MEKLIIIENDIKYEVYPNELLGNFNLFNSSKLVKSHQTELMGWDYAMETCKNYGEGWMLPNKDQLYLMYKKKEYLGMLPLKGYWTCDEYDKNSAYYQYFFTGTQYVLEKKIPSYARPIRQL